MSFTYKKNIFDKLSKIKLKLYIRQIKNIIR